MALSRRLHSRQVLKYHGSEAERAEMRGDILGGSFHVVLCTFKLWEQDSDKAKAERGIFKKLKLSYLILDEAQQIKNSESRRYKNLTAVRSSHRLLLTGTPIENSPRELLSLLAFLMPSTFASGTGADRKGNPNPKPAPTLTLTLTLTLALFLTPTLTLTLSLSLTLTLPRQGRQEGYEGRPGAALRYAREGGGGAGRDCREGGTHQEADGAFRAAPPQGGGAARAAA